MGKRSPAQSKAKDKGIPQQCDDGMRTAMESIAALQKHLPRTMASYYLRNILSASASALCHSLNQAKESDKKEDPLYHQIIAGDLSHCAVEIANTLLSFAQKNPDELSGMLEYLSEWPAVVSLDAAQDIRKVLRNPEGVAARRYAPILDHLGKRTWLCPTAPKAQSIFHQLAKDIVDIISPLSGWAHLYRGLGLPWILDFSNGTNFFILGSTHPRAENKHEWIAAIKYYLYLALAPEPQRTQLREEWLHLRIEAFKLFKLSNDEDRKKHRELCKRIPLPALENTASSNSRSICCPEFLMDDEPRADQKPLWERWWDSNLKYEPAALFGNLDPLPIWDDPAVIKLVTAKAVRGKPMSALSRCSNSVLDAFLTQIGVRNALKTIENRKTPIPKIRAVAYIQENVATEAKALVMHLIGFTAKRQ